MQQTQQVQHEVAEAALRYLGAGWSVLPLRAGDKRPLIRWQELQTQRPSAATVAGWFAQWPHANVGIVTGAISRLVVLDVDPRHGGESSLRDLQTHFGSLPATLEARTGGGGRHLYFAHPGGLVRNRAGLAQGIDLRGDGGYVVAPPSLHPSGLRYAWKTGCAPGDRPAAQLAQWLLRWFGLHIGRSRADWQQLVRDGVAQGHRNSTIAALGGHLLWHGVDPEVALELMLAWNRMRCRPPLHDSEVAQVVASISRLHGEG